MSNIIQLSGWGGKRSPKTEPGGHFGEILFFTGIRYVSYVEPAPSDRPTQEDGNRSSRKKRKRA